MDAKKDIYNLWVQYTTKNDEIYFRQFISGFVNIWQNQLQLDFDNPPTSDSIKNDLGPHINRLPDELLPAIEKFLIIARDDCDKGNLTSDKLDEIELLLQCLTIICRHFDNISTVVKSSYISNCISISNGLFQRILISSDCSTSDGSDNKKQLKLNNEEIKFLKTFCNFLEVIYDPYLIWRNFLHDQLGDVNKFNYKIMQLNAEIVPFIYDCFQSENINLYADIGVNLIHVLGSVISGSQVALLHSQNINTYYLNNPNSGEGSKALQNGLRAISPATITILMNTLSKWETNCKLREIVLNCFTMMTIILQKSSPEQRQIDLLTVFQFYVGVIKDLLTTKQFLMKTSNSESFGISDDDLEEANYFDVNALTLTISTIDKFLLYDVNKNVICNSIFEAKFIPTLVAIPNLIKDWQIDLQTIATTLIRTLSNLCESSDKISYSLLHSNNINILFAGLKLLGKPSYNLIEECTQFAFKCVDDSNENFNNNSTQVKGQIVIKLIEWINDMNDREQIYLSEVLLKKCVLNLQTKEIICKYKVINKISNQLLLASNDTSKKLTSKCVQYLIRLIEELAKYHIDPIELKNLLKLLRNDVENFNYKKMLFETITKISQNNSITSYQIKPIEFLDIQSDTNGITVPEIRKWDTSHGFVFHIWLRLEKLNLDGPGGSNKGMNYRRHIFSLITQQGTGYEFFIQKNGNFILSVNTKKEIFTATVTTGQLLDGYWHSITVSVNPPKRLFSYHQINVYIDSQQKLGSTMKFPAFAEPFYYCSIGAPYNNIRKISQTRSPSSPQHSGLQTQQSEDRVKSGGYFPNIIEKSFLPSLVSQVPSYFTLPPLRTTSSLDPSVKTYPIGMQDLVFGESICLKGQLGCVILAENNINLKSLFDAGPDISNILSTDLIESFDIGSKYVFCFSPSACHDGLCIDLAPGNQYNGHVVSNCCRSITMQDTINGVGGILCLLPILHDIVTNPLSVFIETEELISLKSSPDTSPVREENYGDWEVLQSGYLSEAKMNQNPIACLICLIKNSLSGHKMNQEYMLKADGIGIMGSILGKCEPKTFDVNVLMSVQLLVESISTEISRSNMDLLHVLYKDLVFDFRIWSRAQFQMIIGHIQYISAIIKEDRKYFRKHFGIQYILDTLQEFFVNPNPQNQNNLSEHDRKTIRESMLRVIKYYLQKEINIHEVSQLLSFLAQIKNETVICEVLEMLQNIMDARNCKDQIYLLMYEPHMAELLYVLLLDKNCTTKVHQVVIKLLNSILGTKRISNRHKNSLRLFENSIECGSLYPGLLSYMLPINLESHIVLGILDQILQSDTEMGYAGALCLIYHLNLMDLELKLEIARRLLATTFNKTKSPQMIAKQIGWQESIARLLIKKPIANASATSESDNLGLPDMEEMVKNESESASDLIVFDDENMELTISKNTTSHNNNSLLSEAATVLEHEIKDFADTVSEAVVDNITSVYSVIRQKTSDIQDTLESLTLGSFDDISMHKKHSISNSSSEENISFDDSVSLSNIGNTSKAESDNASSTRNVSSTAQSNVSETDDDQEENLVYLVSNILFTILWRGVENTDVAWKERGQVMACINLIALNNELYCSHVSLRLKVLELGVQAALIDLAEGSQGSVMHQQNAAQLLRMVYDLVVLDRTEDEMKKCSIKLLDGVLSLLDTLMVFQQSSNDDWSEMIHICLGLLLKCSHHPHPEIVAMATAKLHALVQSRNSSSQDPKEIAYLIFSLNVTLSEAIESGNSELYSFLIPVMKAILEKSRNAISLTTNAPDLPATSSGPIFFHEFQMYCTTKQWTTFIEKKIKPLYLAYEKDLSKSLEEPLNTFWAECYEACKLSSQKRAKLQMESRRKFQERILVPWKIRQSEENVRLNNNSTLKKAKDLQVERRWLILKRFLYGKKGAWTKLQPDEEYWRLSHHENVSRMRLKLEPALYHDPHTAASNLRDNTASSTATNQGLSGDLGSTITAAALGNENPDDEQFLLEEELRNSLEPQVPEPTGKEKIIISQECELITLMTRIKGRLDVTTNQFIFTDLTHGEADGGKHDFKFFIIQLREVHLRKYNLRRSALEIFLIDQTSYFLNFTTKTRNKIFTKILSLQPPNILYGTGRSPAELLRSSGLMQKWMNREISNFEYLMHLNTIAGRSYNDLSQYPVFPWILADYSSEILDLTDPKSFRDLSKPIGVVNPKNEEEVAAKYDGFEDPSGMIPKFHYGTHYSNSAGVLHYLIRVEPFTSLHIDLQSGRFDVADRQFHSIPQTWKLLMDNPNDVKELIPEFFYFPEFLKNMNKFDLGVLQMTKERVEDVVLPTWANTPEDFIAIHRRALESDYVSQNLHNWIDLIFGYKQKGAKAAEALNVFYYCSYEGAVDLDKIANPVEREAVEGMINNFGQTPSQLLREPHPKRLTQDDIVGKLLRLEIKKPDLTQFLDRVHNTNCELSSDKDPVIYISTPRSPPRSFLQTSPDMLITITKNGILGCHSWISFDKDKGFSLEIDATTTNLKNRKRINGPFHPSITLNSNLFAVSLDAKYLYCGGIWDNSLRVFNVSKGKAVASVVRHIDIITCIALDNCGSYLVTGSRDCTCIIWSLNNSNTLGNLNQNVKNNLATITVNPILTTAGNNVNSSNLTPKPIHTLYGHDAAVSCVAIMTELDLVVSGSLDGSVNVYSINEGQFIRSLDPIGCSGLNIEISFITISNLGQIAFSALDDLSHSVHVYSINGVSLGSKYVSGRVTGLTTASDYLVVSDDAGDLTMSRLAGLKPVFDIPLHIPTQSIVVTSGNTHILSPLRDGSLSVVGVISQLNTASTSNKKLHVV